MIMRWFIKDDGTRVLQVAEPQPDEQPPSWIDVPVVKASDERQYYERLRARLEAQRPSLAINQEEQP